MNRSFSWKRRLTGWTCSLGLPWLSLCSAQSAEDPTNDASPLRPEPPPKWTIDHLLEAGSDVLWSSDIQLSDSKISYGQTARSWEWRVTGFLKTFDVEYRPNPIYDPPPVGRAEDLSEQTWGGQLEARYRFAERLTGIAAGGFYDGFDGYRSLWLDNYYRQQFSFIPTYKDADPWGANGSLGLRFEYLPSSGFLELEGGYNRDEVAPGYEIETDPLTGAFLRLVRGRESLDSYSGKASTENVWTRNIRTLLEVQLTDTTDRDLRIAIQGSINVALGERWVWRNQTGFTTEDPAFDAWFVSSTLEYEVIPSLLVSVAGHYYDDSGEIVNSLQLSSAAPGLEAWHYGVGARYLWPKAALKLFVGPYFTNYDPVDMGTRSFDRLYKDRDWWLAQLALDVQF